MSEDFWNGDMYTHLEQCLQDEIDKMKDDECDYVFVKTSSRSSKDAPTTIDRLKALYQEALSQCPDVTENNKLISLLTAQREAFKVSSAREVLDSFIQSERIYQDMTIALKVPERFRENFVIRKWFDIDHDMEFRGFCYKGKLTALSQYHHLCYFPRIEQMSDEIVYKCQNFFTEHVADKMAPILDSYIVDFALCGEN
eukprot:CAMPEP_0174271058 /NCGR_PEP_ID=MMETSP0439-20130205/46645_1 /TAXON_ID=0 /ORGANISM="Stereomyxa ramosa, Strain Chinc5" /LENGTH=197 /DNA_ID=CAMNT_0015360813 /DNA_START=95 /DNA_END=685 /DNA_ORIENTATION=-